MITYPLELTVLTIQEESFVSNDFYTTDTETSSIFVRLLAIGINFGNSLISDKVSPATTSKEHSPRNFVQKVDHD